MANSGIDANNYDGREGFGLRNTRARLKQLYGERQELRLENNPGGGCRVMIVIPLAKAAALISA